jgi:hypothetical protein
MMTDHPGTFSAILSVLLKWVCQFRYCLHLLVPPCAHHWRTYKDHERKASHDDQSTWNFLRPFVNTCQILLPIKILSILPRSTLRSSCLEYNDLWCKALYVNKSSWKFLMPCVCIFRILLPIQILSALACSTIHPSWLRYIDHWRKALHDDQSSWKFLTHYIGIFQTPLPTQMSFALACSTLRSSSSNCSAQRHMSYINSGRSVLYELPWCPIDLKLFHTGYRYLSNRFANSFFFTLTCSTPHPFWAKYIEIDVLRGATLTNPLEIFSHQAQTPVKHLYLLTFFSQSSVWPCAHHKQLRVRWTLINQATACSVLRFMPSDFQEHFSHPVRQILGGHMSR